MSEKDDRVVKRLTARKLAALTELYEQERLFTSSKLRMLAADYLVVRDIHAFVRNMREALRDYYVRLALIASQGEVNSWNDAELLLGRQYDFLDEFANDLLSGDEFSSEQILARASRYSYAWSVFARYTLPDEIADILPAMPGVDCLGLDACGCWWEFEITRSGYLYAWWRVNLSKEHCPICMDYGVTYSPFIAILPDVEVAEGEELDDEDILDLFY